MRTPPLALAPLAIAVLLSCPGGARAAQFDWLAGNFVSGVTAPNPLPAGDELRLLSGANKSFSSTAFSNQGLVTWDDGTISLVSNATLTNQLGARWEAFNDNVMNFGGGSNSSFVNAGMFRKSAGTGSTRFDTVNVVSNGGTWEALAGTIQFNSGNSQAFNTGTTFTRGVGTGTNLLTSNATFSGQINTDNLRIDAGTASGNAAQVAGVLAFNGGAVAGGWTVNAGSTLVLQSALAKSFSSAALSNLGTATWEGSNLSFVSASNFDNQGLFDAWSDHVLNFGGGSNSSFTSSGTFRKSAGSGSTRFDTINVVSNGGTWEALTGTIQFNSGNSQAFNTGTTFTRGAGSGVNLLTASATFSGLINTDNLRIDSGTASGNAAQVAGTLAFAGGALAGSWAVNAGSTLSLQGGAAKSLSGATLLNLGTTTWSGSNLALVSATAIDNQGVIDAQSDHVITFGGGSNSSFTNRATFRKSAGAGTTRIDTISFINDTNGVLDAQTGTIQYNSGNGQTFRSGTEFRGAGVHLLTANATFAGTQTATGNLRVSAGSMSGVAAALAGTLDFQSGDFTGGWTVNAGATFQASGGGAKSFSGANFVNQGTLRWADSNLALVSSTTLRNQGLLEASTDHVIVYGGGSNSQVINEGVWRKSGGVGETRIDTVAFTNAAGATLEAQTGTLRFNSGNGQTFNAGSRWVGAGVHQVSNNASFNGAQDFYGNVRLTSGTYTGSGAAINGTLDFEGGTIGGQWAVNSGATLRLQAAGTKALGGASFTNNGTIAWGAGNLNLVSATNLVNAGLLDLQGDNAMAYGGGSNSSFSNQGEWRKSGGSGTSSISTIAVANTAAGLINVQTGTLQVGTAMTQAGTIRVGAGATFQSTPALANLGTLTGTGTIQAIVNNQGTVAPGLSPGVLTLVGNFTQTATGALAIEVNQGTEHDTLLVTGNVNLGGTLGAICFADCAYAIGDELVVLDYTGSRSGSTFASLTLSNFASGNFAIVYDDTNTRVLLRVTEAVTAVPEPHSWALWLAGAAALGTLRRRRQRDAGPFILKSLLRTR